MWKPRPGTEADLVEKEVARRKKIATDKGLGKLFSNVYHNRMYAYAAWIKNHNRGGVHPEITEANEKWEGGNSILEFVFRNKKYKVSKSPDRGLGISLRDDSVYCDLELFMEGEKVFAISESVYADEWSTTYSPIGIDAYVNENWVADFRELEAWHDKHAKEIEIQFAEDPKKVARLKQDFGITELPKNKSVEIAHEITEIKSDVKKKPMSKNTKITLWIIGILIFLWLISQ